MRPRNEHTKACVERAVVQADDEQAFDRGEPVRCTCAIDALEALERAAVRLRSFSRALDMSGADRAIVAQTAGALLDMAEDFERRYALADAPSFGAVPVRTCQGCGCTDAHPCAGGCSWASSTPYDLCSKCVPQIVGTCGAYRIERVHLPSAIRFGRLAVDPAWIVVGPGEERKRFMRKKDARAFVDTKIEEEKAAQESERAP